MTPEVVTPELVKWLIGSLAACGVAIVGAVVWLSVLTFRIGQKYGAVEEKLERFEDATKKLEGVHENLSRVDTLEARFEQLVESHAEERRRFASDWPEYKSKVDVLYEKVFSLTEWRKSNPKMGR